MKKKYSNFKKSNKKKYNIPTSGKKSNKKYILKHNNRKLIKLKKNKKSKVGKNNKNNTPLKGGKKNNNNNNNDNNNDNNDEGNNYNNNNNNGDNDNDNNLSNILGKDSKLNNVDLFSQSKNSDNQSSLSTTTSTTNSNSNSSMGASALKSTLNNLGDNLNIDNLSEEELKMLIAENNNDNNSEPNYYNTLSFEEKVKTDATQGLYLPGFDFTNFLDYTNYKFKKDNSDASEEDLKTIDIFGEDVNISYDDVVNKKLGYRDYRIDNTLKPEIALTELASFNDIITEAKKYTSQKRKYVTMYGLYNMVIILSKYKKSEAQWLRVASLLEITHKYKGGNISRGDFFNSQLRLDMDTLNAMEEFWKTDHIFMTDQELEKFKNDLEFYRHVEEEN